MSTTVATTPEGLARRSVETLRWAGSLFRPGSSSASALARLAAAIEHMPDGFRPLSGYPEARRTLAALSEAADAALAAMERLPEGTLPGSCDGSLREAARLARNDLATLDRSVVPYGAVLDELRGSWGDGDLSEAIRALSHDLRSAVEEDRQAMARRVEALAEPRR